jgi:hypothetical protein
MCVCTWKCVCVFCKSRNKTRFFISTHFYHKILHVKHSSQWINLNYNINSTNLLYYITYIYKESGCHIFTFHNKDFQHYSIPTRAILTQVITSFGNFTYYFPLLYFNIRAFDNTANNNNNNSNNNNVSHKCAILVT